AEVAKAEPAKPAQPDPNAVVPSRRDSAPAAKHTMRDKIQAVKDRVEKALKDRKRKREEALAVANAKRAADAKAEATATFPAQTISAPPPDKARAPAAAAVPAPPVVVASNAPKAAPVQPSQPTGAISGIGDGDMMVSKAPKYATATAAASFAAATVKE